MSKHDVAIIGAGPAGILAAITAAERGRRVILIDRNAQIGRKLLSTGNGRCNLTNARVSADQFHGANREFIRAVLNQFDQHATMEFFRDLGLVLKEEDEGRIFPRTNQASSVVEVLKRRLSSLRVDIEPNAQVMSIEKVSAWQIMLASGSVVEADRLIIATGGRAAHQLGSTGDGLSWARKLGHTLVRTHAALVPMETVETWPRELQGTKLEARVWTTSEGRTIGESTGDLLFTNYGVSGLSVLALAGGIGAIVEHSPVTLHIDLFPDMTTEQLERTISDIVESSSGVQLEDALIGLLPANMIPIVLKLSGSKQPSAAAKLLKDLQLTVSKLRPFKEAQVTCGGVSADEIDPQTMQSTLLPGLCFAGEVIDVDGDSGGFNLQWAWSSGRVAGMNA